MKLDWKVEVDRSSDKQKWGPHGLRTLLARMPSPTLGSVVSNWELLQPHLALHLGQGVY